MSEMAQTAQHLVVIGRGRLIADTSMEHFIAGASHNLVRVRTTDPDSLASVLRGPDVVVAPAHGDALQVTGLRTDQIGMAAGRAGITLLELSAQQTSLEESFMDLTKDDVEYHGATMTTGGASPLETAGADR
jgi:ABC-2 type transport system ATP-binding protein